MVKGEGAVDMAQDLDLPLDVMAAVSVHGDGQGQPLKRYAVVLAHRSLYLSGKTCLNCCEVTRQKLVSLSIKLSCYSLESLWDSSDAG